MCLNKSRSFWGSTSKRPFSNRRMNLTRRTGIIPRWLTSTMFQVIWIMKKWAQLLYSSRRLIGSRILESVAYFNQKLQAHLYLNSTQNTSVNWIIRLLLSLFFWPKVILLSGGHCSWRKIWTIFVLYWKNHLKIWYKRRQQGTQWQRNLKIVSY